MSPLAIPSLLSSSRGDFLQFTHKASTGYLSQYASENDTTMETIIDTIENMSDDGEESYRGDMISNVNKGLGVVATGIKIISALLTVLGGTSNRRYVVIPYISDCKTHLNKKTIFSLNDISTQITSFVIKVSCK